MKRFITLLLLSVLFTSAALAQDMDRRYQQTRLSISSFYNSQVRIVIDGNNYSFNNNRDNDELTLTNLSAGNHSIKIYRSRGRRYGNQQQTVIYDATVYLRPQYYTDIVINRFGRVYRDEMSMNDYDQQGNQSYPSGYPQSGNREMSAENFNALKATVSNDPYDNSRVNIVRQAANSNYFTAIQVKQLLQVFSYENSKLAVAKLLYSRTVDKGNYFMVNDAFTYSNSKDELAAYIRDNP